MPAARATIETLPKATSPEEHTIVRNQIAPAKAGKWLALLDLKQTTSYEWVMV